MRKAILYIAIFLCGVAISNAQVISHRIYHEIIDSNGIEYENIKLDVITKGKLKLPDSQFIRVGFASIPYIYVYLDTSYVWGGVVRNVYQNTVSLTYLDHFDLSYQTDLGMVPFSNLLDTNYKPPSFVLYESRYGANESSFGFRHSPIIYCPLKDSLLYNLGLTDPDSDELDYGYVKQSELSGQENFDINTAVGEIIFKDFEDTGTYVFSYSVTEEVFDPLSKDKQRTIFPLVVKVIDSIEFGQFTFYDDDGKEDWRRFRIVDPAKMQSIKFKYENRDADSIKLHWLNNMFLADGETSFKKWRENSESFGEWKWQPDATSLYHYMIYPVVFEAEFWKNGHPYYQHLSYAIIRDTINGVGDLLQEGLLKLANNALINESTEAGSIRLYEVGTGKLLYQGGLLSQQGLDIGRYANRCLIAVFTTSDKKYQILKVLLK